MSADDQEQRARLLEGLVASIREKGLAQTQLTDIVRHAKASRRTFYKHFPDKDSAFVEVTRLVSAEIRQRVVEVVDPSAQWSEQVDAAVDRFLHELAAEPALTATFASPSLGPQIVLAQRDAIEQFAVLICSLTEGDAFARAGIAPIPLEQSRLLIGGMHLAVVGAVERDEPLEELGPHFKVVWKAVLGNPPKGV
jgi:AcrR family transcriptional regulator